MDANEILENLRMAIRRWEGTVPGSREEREAAEVATASAAALDDHLCHGGDPPEEWKRPAPTGDLTDDEIAQRLEAEYPEREAAFRAWYNPGVKKGFIPPDRGADLKEAFLNGWEQHQLKVMRAGSEMDHVRRRIIQVQPGEAVTVFAAPGPRFPGRPDQKASRPDQRIVQMQPGEGGSVFTHPGLMPSPEAARQAARVSQRIEELAAINARRREEYRNGGREAQRNYVAAMDVPIELWRDEPMRPATWGVVRDKAEAAARADGYVLLEADRELEHTEVRFMKLILSDSGAPADDPDGFLRMDPVECAEEEAELVHLRLIAIARPAADVTDAIPPIDSSQIRVEPQADTEAEEPGLQNGVPPLIPGPDSHPAVASQLDPTAIQIWMEQNGIDRPVADSPGPVISNVREEVQEEGSDE
jgi:hypothetical protein